MVWIFLIIVAGFVIYNFSKDTKVKNVELASQGGIKTKYKELISSFDDFDIIFPFLSNKMHLELVVPWSSAIIYLPITPPDLLSKKPCSKGRAFIKTYVLVNL